MCLNNHLLVANASESKLSCKRKGSEKNSEKFYRMCMFKKYNNKTIQLIAYVNF